MTKRCQFLKWDIRPTKTGVFCLVGPKQCTKNRLKNIIGQNYFQIKTTKNGTVKTAKTGVIKTAYPKQKTDEFLIDYNYKSQTDFKPDVNKKAMPNYIDSDKSQAQTLSECLKTDELKNTSEIIEA